MPQAARRTQHARARSASLLQRGQHVLKASQPVALRAMAHGACVQERAALARAAMDLSRTLNANGM